MRRSESMLCNLVRVNVERSSINKACPSSELSVGASSNLAHEVKSKRSKLLDNRLLPRTFWTARCKLQKGAKMTKAGQPIRHRRRSNHWGVSEGFILKYAGDIDMDHVSRVVLRDGLCPSEYSNVPILFSEASGLKIVNWAIN